METLVAQVPDVAAAVAAIRTVAAQLPLEPGFSLSWRGDFRLYWMDGCVRVRATAAQPAEYGPDLSCRIAALLGYYHRLLARSQRTELDLQQSELRVYVGEPCPGWQ